MSKLFGRVGTVQAKYQFELSVVSLHMSLPLTTPMCVKWTRGPRTATNQPVSGVGGEYAWPTGKPMQIVATMYYKKNAFQAKLSKLTVKQLLGKELKSVGQVELDLADFCAASTTDGEVSRTLTLKLQKCSDKKAFLVVLVKSRWLKQLQEGADDTASQMSGASSVDARSESAMPSQSRGDVADLNDLDGMEDAQEDDGSSARPAPTVATNSHLQMSPSNGPASPESPSNERLEQQLRDQFAEIDQLRARVAELTIAVNAERGASGRCLVLTSQLSQLQQSHDGLIAEKQQLEAEHDQAEVKLRTALKNSQAELEKAAQDHQHATVTFERQLADQLAQAESLRARLATSSSSNSGANGAGGNASAFDQERSTLERQLAEVRGELSHATTLTHEAFASLTAQEAQWNTKQQEHARDLASKEAEGERLEAALKERDTRLQAATDEAKTREAAAAELRRSEKELKVELASLQASFVGEMTRRETAEQKLEESERAMQDVRTAAKKAELAQEAELKQAKAAAHTEREKMKEEHAVALAATSAASSPAASALPSSEAAGLQKKVEELSLRLVATEEERARLEAECATMESSLSAQKENELVLLEERYEESYKAKKALKEKENEVEELQRGTRESVRDAKDARLALEKAQKEAREKGKQLESSEASVESLTSKLQRSVDDAKKNKQMADLSAARIREIEAIAMAAAEAKQALETELKSKTDELTRAHQKREEMEAQWETERAALKRELEELEEKAAHAPPAASAAEESSDVAAAEATAADLLYTQTLLIKRNGEVTELEATLKELRTRLRVLEDIEATHTSLVARSKESETTAAKKLADLSREKVAVEEELAVVKEKREKDRAKLAERDDREKETRLASLQVTSETSAALAALQLEVESANSKIDDLQEQLASKQSKVAEQQDKLNALTRTGEVLTREHAEAREQLAILSTKHDQASKAATEAAARLESDKTSHSAALASLEQQLANLTARRMVFEAIEAEALAALARDKTSAASPAGSLALTLQRKISFYEEQLVDADESILLAKQSWQATSGVLVAQVAALEAALTVSATELRAALESKGLDAAKAQALDARLKKAEKDKSKLSELMSRFEVELTTKKVELAASLDQLSTQEYENEKLRAQLSKQIKQAEQTRT